MKANCPDWRMAWGTLGLLVGLCGCGSATPDVPGSPAPPDETGTIAPIAPTVRIVPEQPRAGLDALTCLAEGADSVSWSHDDAPLVEGPDVDALAVTPGVWRCVAEGEGGTASAEVTAEAVGGNLLVVLIDDVGIDKVSTYGVHPQAPPTPRLDALADEGVLFRNAYALPLCSPTRMALLTGRLASRTGVGNLVPPTDPNDWLATEDTLPLMLRRSSEFSYTSAMAGKWHVSHIADLTAPSRSGFDWHAGSMNNPKITSTSDGVKPGYAHWEKNTNGELAFVDTYMTTDTVDDAIGQLQTMPEPWLLYVPFNAAHEPWHAPPEELTGVDPATVQGTEDKMDLMVQVLDAELGRLLDAMTEAQRADTTIVVVGDNGTQREVIREPGAKGRGKGTVYEAGVRVPLIIVSPHVVDPGRESEALVHVVDIFSTAAALAGVDLSDGIERDGLSWLPLLSQPQEPWPRQFLYSEMFSPNGQAPTRRWYTMRDHEYKLYVGADAGTQLFALDPAGLDEGTDLLDEPALTAEQQDALDRLTEAADAMNSGLWP